MFKKDWRVQKTIGFSLQIKLFAGFRWFKFDVGKAPERQTQNLNFLLRYVTNWFSNKFLIKKFIVKGPKTSYIAR